MNNEDEMCECEWIRMNWRCEMVKRELMCACVDVNEKRQWNVKEWMMWIVVVWNDWWNVCWYVDERVNWIWFVWMWNENDWNFVDEELKVNEDWCVWWNVTCDGWSENVEWSFEWRQWMWECDELKWWLNECVDSCMWCVNL